MLMGTKSMFVVKVVDNDFPFFFVLIANMNYAEDLLDTTSISLQDKDKVCAYFIFSTLTSEITLGIWLLL